MEIMTGVRIRSRAINSYGLSQVTRVEVLKADSTKAGTEVDSFGIEMLICSL
jgi:hypothetical protein